MTGLGRARAIGALAILASSWSLSGCSAFTLFPYGGSRVSGEIVSRGGELGDFTFVPRQCRRSAWNAVDWTAPEGRVVRLTTEPIRTTSGASDARLVLHLARPDAPGGPREIVVHADQCEGWYGYAHWFQRDGAIQLACTLPDGGEIRGYATFMGCS